MPASSLLAPPDSSSIDVDHVDTHRMDADVVHWIRSMRRRNLSPATIDKRASVARRLCAATGCAMIDVTAEHIEAWLDRPISARTRYSDISHISTFFTWAMRHDLALFDPTARIDRPKVRTGLPRPIDRGELAHALEQATGALRAMMLLASYGGLRCAEIAHLHAEDVNGDMMLVHGKGGRDRVIPLHPAVAAALDGLGIGSYGPVFDVPAWKVSHLIRSHLHACGSRATAHQLRHWFATATYEASGHDLRMVQELLGHSSPTTTAIYTRWSRASAGDAVDSLEAT